MKLSRTRVVLIALVSVVLTLGSVCLPPAAAQSSNGVLREVYLNISGNAVSDLTSHPSFPDNPSLETIQPTFEAPTEFAESYGQRMRALLVAPQTGRYKFWIASDDNGALFLSTTESPAQKTQIATVNTWTSSREWTKEPNQLATNIMLTAGQRYYIEALQKEGGGGDNLAVRWQLPSGTIEEPIPNNRLIVYGLGPPVITQQPSNVSVVEGGAATFTVRLQRTIGSAFQWKRNGAAIPGATNPMYTLAPVFLADSNSTFFCSVTNAYGGTNSSSALLAVLPDTTRPAIATVGNLGEPDIVFVVFSEPVEAASGTNDSNYTINNGIRVLRASFGVDARTIILTTTAIPAGITNTLTVNNVRDRATTPNTILPDTQRTFSLVVRPIDIGVLSLPRETLGPSSRRHGVVISEVMYHPTNRADGRNLEFVELYNAQPWFEELGGWRISGAIDYVFPSNAVLQGRSFLVVAANPADFRAAYSFMNVLGPFANSNALQNSSGTLRLRNSRDAVLFEMNYSGDPPYPAAADGGGHSLVLARPSYGERDPRAWAASDIAGGNPGTADVPAGNTFRTIVINEFLAHTDLPDVDYVELYNYGNNSLNIGNCILTDDPATNKFLVPTNTVLPGGGFIAFTEAQLGFALSSGGETIFLKHPSGQRVIDAVRFEAQENGVATGRFPDGAPRFTRLRTPTPGTNNAPFKPAGVVINEIMFDPITSREEDEYIELYNRGTNAVNLAGWRIRDAVSFNIPEGTMLPAGGYLVIAKDAAQLRTKYPGLTPIGGYSGSLGNGGERIELNMPDQVIGTNASGQLRTNVIHIPVDEVTYGPGGRWGKWAGGGGSSLELRDARADRRLAPNWADSDESAKSQWVTVEATGAMDNGWADAYQLHVTLLGAGEALLDNVEVIPAGRTNVIGNGTFESGANGWVFQGNHNETSWEPNEGFGSARSLHLRATGRGDTGSNRVRTQLPYTLAPGTTVTLRAKVRWLKGHPNILLRLRGNWMEAPGYILTARNLGTPGAPNSRAAANAGPAITDVRHSPPCPAANQPVLVVAQVNDPDGLAYFAVNYRIDPATNYFTLAMTNNGAGLFSAIIPGQAGGASVAFHLRATDNFSPAASSAFPADAPARECIVRWGDSSIPGTLPAYRIWISQTNVNRWSLEERMSNNPKDITFVYGTNRVIYNAGGWFHGSPYHSPGYNSPVGNSCDYDLGFPPDDRLLGETDINLFRPGNGGGDGTGQTEIQGYWFAAQFGLPFLYHRPVFLFVNGQRRETIFHDAQQPNGDFIDQWFPDDPDGDLHKIQLGFEFGDQAYGASEQGYAVVGANLGRYTTTGGVKKQARYRQTWPRRAAAPQELNDYTNIFNLVEVALTNAANGSEAYTAAQNAAVDVEEWFKVHVTQHLYNNPDSFSYGGGQNAFAYKPERDTWKLFLWDIDFAFGGSPTDANLTGIGGADHGPRNSHPPFARIYWQALLEAANGMMTPGRSDVILDSRYNGMVAGGAAVGSPSGIKSFIASRRNYILQRAATNQSPFAIKSNGGADFTTNRNLITLTGTAPLQVRTILINGVPYPITWTSLSNWVVRVPLMSGTNTLTVTGTDPKGAPVAGVSGTIRVNYTGADELPQNRIVINEIMYNPVAPDAGFVEIHNTSPANAFDLSGWRVNGVDFTFPNGAVIDPGAFLLLVKQTAAFLSAYDVIVPVAGEFNGALDQGGETLTLLKPGSTPAEDLIIDQVTYDDDPPWPAAADGAGPSLQLVDPLQDNNRVANWAVSSPLNRFTPGAVNSVRATRAAFPALWLNEVLPNNVSAGTNGVVDRFGDRDPWVELYNGGTNALSLSGYYLANSYSNLAQWAFPASTVINPGQFLVVWLDGEPGESVTNELHAGFRAAPDIGSIVLSKGTNLAPIIDYLNYNVAVAGRSFGSFPDGAVSGRRTFSIVTPGATNNPAFPPVDVLINEWMADNATTLADAADGDYEDWFELYNPGATAVELGGYFLSDTLASPTQWAIPAGTSVPARGHLLVWADGEPGQNNMGQTNVHAGFSLSKTGEAIALFAQDGTLIDAVTFGPQTTDVSQGRFPDGGTSIIAFTNATPGTANVLSGSNTPPALAFISDRVVDEGSLLTFTAVATDEDVPAQLLMFSLDAGAPAGAGINPTNGLFTWIPAEDQGPGSYSVTIRVTDNPGNGEPPLNDAQTFHLTVNEANNAPVLAPLLSRNVAEGTLLTVTNLASDSDPVVQTLTFSLEPGAPSGMTIDPASGLLTWMPGEDQGPGTYSVAVRVSDDGNPPRNDTKSFSVFVSEVNTPPFIPLLGDQIARVGALFSLRIPGMDTDLPEQTLVFSLEPGAPAGMQIDPATGLLSWAPGMPEMFTTNAVTVRVTDDGSPSQANTGALRIVVLPKLETTITLNGDKVSIRAETLIGRTYRVDFKENFASPTWTPLSNPVTATSGIMTFTDNAAGQAQRFYRLVQLD